MSIHIKPENKGKFNATKKRTGKTTEELTHSKNPLTRKRAVFAQNAKKWKKGEYGLDVDPTIPTKDQNPLFGTELPLGIEDLQRIIANPETIKSQNIKQPAPTIDLNFKGSQPNVAPKKDKNIGTEIALGLSALDMLIPKQRIKRNYIRPEDTPSFNPLPYGTGSQAIMKKGGKMKKCEEGGVFGDKKKKKKQEEPIQPLDVRNIQPAGYSGIQTEKGENLNPSDLQIFLNSIEYFKNNGPDSNIYRDKWQHHSFDQVKPINPTDASMAKKGLTVMSYADGGLQTYSGGKAPRISENIFDGGMGEFQGASHDNGGIKSTYAGKPFEAEGGEPYRITEDGSLEIFGALKNPLTGKSFKSDAKKIAKQEKKATKITDKGTELVNQSPESKDKFELLKFNAGAAMLKGGMAQQKKLSQDKKSLSFLQNLMLVSEGKNPIAEDGAIIPIFKKGGIMKYPDGGKPWKYKGTKKDNLNEKIKGFVKLVEEKGLTGYSGEKSGYDKRNTKSGRPSRHASNQALDMIFDDKDAYQKILKDPELSKYLYDNGLTAINEYDPSIASKTGATAGHLHIGYDKGTATSDKFRNDYKSLYNPSNSPKLIANPQKAAYRSAPSGDAQTEYTGWDFKKLPISNNKKERVNTTPPVSEPFNFTNPVDKPTPQLKSEFPLEQALPLIPALTDRTDPVFMQKFTPELYSPYNVSFQDRRNRNTAQLKSVEKAAAYDPTALGVLGAQAYQANNEIDAEEFRTNQGIYNDVVNKNVALKNNAQSLNLQLADQQYVRQETAKGNTRDRRTDALIALTDLVAKNNLENKTLNVAHNLYKDYTYDENGQLQYVGPSAGELINYTGFPSKMNTKTTQTTKEGNTTIQNTYEPVGYVPTKRTIRKKDGGKITQSKLSKLMYS